MMGDVKLSTIREKLRATLKGEQADPIPALDRRIRELEMESKGDQPELRSLRRLRGALAQVLETKPRKKTRPARSRRAAKAR